MADDERQTPEGAQRRAVRQREAFREAVEAVQESIDRKTERVEQVVDVAKRGFDSTAGFVRKHPWLCLGVALTFGVALGVRRRRPHQLPARIQTTPTGSQLVTMIEEPRRGPVLRTFVGALGVALAKVAAQAAGTVLSEVARGLAGGAAGAAPEDEDDSPQRRR